MSVEAQDNDGIEHSGAPPSPPPKRSRREERWERRRRRIWLEEVTGWILVPIIVLASYWLLELVLSSLGTSLGAIINGLSTIISGL
jgi:hypothetical protein